MEAAARQVVRFHYAVSELGQPAFETSRKSGQPIAALLGAGNIIPGLEQALEGRNAGDSFEITVPAALAYGERQPGMVQRIAKKHIPKGVPTVVGQTLMVNTQQGQQRMATIVKVGMSVIDLDLNHPLAGRDLHFDIEVVDVRAASNEEIAHGHAHGDGGVAHES